MAHIAPGKAARKRQRASLTGVFPLLSLYALVSKKLAYDIFAGFLFTDSLVSIHTFSCVSTRYLVAKMILYILKPESC